MRVERYSIEADASERYGYGGGDTAALRAYQAFHPNAAIYTVTYRGRTVWMTSKQQAIWHEARKYWNRGKRDSLQRIANAVGCSKATVSRFLRRLDLWRFLDLATIVGRNGGVYIFTRTDPYNEKPQRWTLSRRKRERDAIARMIRKGAMERLEPLMQRYRKPHPLPIPFWETAVQGRLPLTGSTGATFTIPK